MKDFIIFSNNRGCRTALRKSEILDVMECSVNGKVLISASGDTYETCESFDSIISKLTEE